MKRRTRHEPTAQEVHAFCLPDVPFASLSGMAIGKAAPETAAESQAVILRIKREAGTRLVSREFRKQQEEAALSPTQIEEIGKDLLGL